MLKISYEEILKKIKEEKGLSQEEIESRIKSKLDQLSGLISREGAAHIVANELGIKVFPDMTKKRYKVKEVIAGLRGVEVVGRVVRKYEIREFKTEKREGRVFSFLLGDETGVLRIVIWDDSQIKQMENIDENDIVKIVNAYSRENQGFRELHLGNRSEIILNPEGEDVSAIKQVRDFTQKKIEELQVGDLVKVLGTIVQVFEPKFYDACPHCNKKVNLEADKHTCPEHGLVIPKPVPILNFLLDDGTDNIRVVCFRDTVNKVTNKTEGEVLEYKENPLAFESVKQELLGKHVMLTGRVTKNEMFDRLEFIAHDTQIVDPKKLVAILQQD